MSKKTSEGQRIAATIYNKAARGYAPLAKKIDRAIDRAATAAMLAERQRIKWAVSSTLARADTTPSRSSPPSATFWAQSAAR